MDIEDEKRAFSKRLKQALEVSGMGDMTLSNIAIKFNLLHPHKPVTPQTVHNWLIGASIPTADKVKTLAKLLKTSVGWLRYGEMEYSNLNSNELLLLQYFNKLSKEKQIIILSLLKEF